MQLIPFLLLLCAQNPISDTEPIFTKTYTQFGKQVPYVKHSITTHPRTGQVTDVVKWTSVALQHDAYRKFFERLPIPAYKSETRAEPEAIQKQLVHDLIAKQVPPGTPIEKLEAFLLENGFMSQRRPVHMPPNSISLSAHETVRTGFLEWNNYFAILVHAHFDDAGKVTSFEVRRAYFTYPHKGIFAD